MASEMEAEVCGEVFDWCVRACVFECIEPWEEEVTSDNVMKMPGDGLVWG